MPYVKSDSHGGFYPGGNASAFHLRHRSQANVLFADLHVAPQSADQLSDMGIEGAYDENLSRLDF